MARGTNFGCQNWSGGTVFGGGPIFSLQDISHNLLRAKQVRDAMMQFIRRLYLAFIDISEHISVDLKLLRVARQGILT